MSKREAINGKPYAGNPHVRFDEGEAASTATSRRGSLLYRKNKIMIIGISLFAVTPLFAEIWHLSKNSSGKGKGWQGDDAGGYWSDSAGNPGSGQLVSSDTYWHKDGLQLRAQNDFAGGDLYVGDTNAPNYTTRLCMDGHVQNDGNKLMLSVGYAYKNPATQSSGVYNMKSPTIASPKDRPFGFFSRLSDHRMKITGVLDGEKGVGFVFGGYYDGSAIVYRDTTNVTLTVEADMSDYHGDIKIVSNKPLTSPTKGNVTFSLHPAQSDATLEIESGAEFKIASAGEVRLSGLTLHAESLLTIPYNSTSHTTGVVRVTDTFSIPENEGKVRLWFETLPAAKNDQPCAFPVLIVPDTQTLEVERFILSNEASVNVYEKPLFCVIEDSENRTKSLVAIFPGRGKLTESDSDNYFETDIAYDFSVHASAFTNATSWSNDNLPHEFTIYEFGYVTNKFGQLESDRGYIIRTPFNRADDYVFPGLVLRSVGTRAFFVLADNTKTTINLELTSPLSLNVVKGKDPTLAGTIRMDDDVTSSAWSGSLVTIDSVLSGNGDWTVSGKAGTGSPHSRISFTADNSEWKGAISLKQDKGSSGVPSTGNAKHQKLLVTNPAGLGGVLDEFNCKALSLADCSEMIVTNSLELAKDLNRGIYVTNTATINVYADCDFICNWPVTFDGPLRKDGEGTLSLGGDAKFLDSAGEPVGVPRSDVDCRMEVVKGSVKVLRHDCVNGVTVDFKANADTSLVLEFDPDDADLKRYGLCNVKTETPFTAGKEINVRIDNPDADALIAAKTYKLGLITVTTSAANALNLDSLIKFNKPAEFENLRVRMIREDDGETGLTTYSAYYDFVGFQVIVR